MLFGLVILAFVWIQCWLLWQCGGSLLVAIVAATVAAVRVALPKSNSALWTLVGGVLAAAALASRSLIYNPIQLSDGNWALLVAEALVLAQGLVLIGAGMSRIWLLSFGMATVLALAHCTLENETSDHLVAGTLFAGLTAVLVCDAGFYEHRGPRSLTLQRQLLTCLVLATAAGLAAWSGQRVSSAATAARIWLSNALAQRAMTPRVNVLGFSGLATLNSITKVKQSDPMNVALRAYGDKMPGYLRARSYLVYDGNQWYSSRRRRLLKPSGQRNETGQNTFALSPQPPQRRLRELTVRNVQHRRSGFCFLPLNTALLQGDAEEVAVSPSGVIRGGLNTARPYTALLDDNDTSPPPDPDHTRALLHVPDFLAPQIATMAARICSRHPTTGDKIKAIISHLKTNYVYSLEGFTTPAGAHPLNHFLLERPAAHCELFAASAVMLLRLQGVRCRFATGFLVTQLDTEYGEYWVGRNRDAHAWAEAYDESLGRWVIVEATPGVEIPDTDSPEAELSTVSEMSSAAARRDFIRELWMNKPWLVFGSLAAIGLLGVGLVFGRRRRGRDPLQRSFQRLAADLRRRKLVREFGETLHQFASRMRTAAPNDPWIDKAADWILGYADVRYSGATRSLPPPPSPKNKRRPIGSAD